MCMKHQIKTIKNIEIEQDRPDLYKESRLLRPRLKKQCLQVIFQSIQAQTEIILLLFKKLPRINNFLKLA